MTVPTHALLKQAQDLHDQIKMFRATAQIVGGRLAGEEDSDYGFYSTSLDIDLFAAQSRLQRWLTAYDSAGRIFDRG